MNQPKVVPTHILWIDMEMTGLDPAVNNILELAAVVTDSALNIVEIGPDLIIAQDESTFATMDAWNQSHHSQSGLWKKALISPTSLVDAEEALCAFIKKYFPKGQACLAGNTIWQDRRFIMAQMKKADSLLHYRMLDVSAFKIAANLWYPKLSFKKKDAHRAMGDILESIEELKFYREQLLQKEINP